MGCQGLLAVSVVGGGREVKSGTGGSVWGAGDIIMIVGGFSSNDISWER